MFETLVTLNYGVEPQHKEGIRMGRNMDVCIGGGGGSCSGPRMPLALKVPLRMGNDVVSNILIV